MTGPGVASASEARDAELLDRYVGGDRDAFDQIAGRYAGMVYRTALRVCGRGDLAEDAAQATFIVMMERAGRLKVKGTLASWLHVTARNAATDLIRAEARRKRHERSRHEQAPGRPPGPGTARWEDVKPALDGSLSSLPRAEREAVILRYLVGTSQDEAARLLGVTRRTVINRTNAGLRRLRGKLARAGVSATVAALGPMLAAEGAEAPPASVLSDAAAASGGRPRPAAAEAARGVMRMMTMAKIKAVAAVFLAAAALGAGAMFAAAAAGSGEEAVKGWPQLGRNPQRWNYSPETIAPPYRVRWVKDMTDFGMVNRLFAAAQVIVGNGQVFVGSKGGLVVALDARTGKDNWTYQTDGPILHTVGYANNTVFAATMKGSVFGINAKTGRKAWQFSTGRRYGFSTAILLAEGRAFSVDRGGALYALSPVKGTPVWKQPYVAGAPVFQSPAYNNGVVFFGSEDLRMHAVRAGDGRRLWRSEQVGGVHLVDYWPVVLHGEVLFRPYTGLAPSPGGARDQDRFRGGFVALNEKTGKPGPVVPHYLAGSMTGPVAPPSATRDGLLVHHWKVGPNDWDDWGWGLLDSRKRAMQQVFHSEEEMKREKCPPGTGAQDETMISSVFGEAVVVIHHAGFAGNPRTQSGAYHRGESRWYAAGKDAPNPSVESRLWRRNNQAEGACAVSGANGLLYHQRTSLIVCYESRKR